MANTLILKIHMQIKYLLVQYFIFFKSCFFSLVIMAEANTIYHSSDAYSILKENTIPSNQLRVISKLASGQFGRVYKGNE